MRKTTAAADPDAYVVSFSGWQRQIVDMLRGEVRAAFAFDEVVKWRHLVYFANGPAVLIRAEDERVLLGFWRGQRLREIEPRLKPGGKYEMASLELREGMTVEADIVHRLALEAASLNQTLGDPTKPG